MYSKMKKYEEFLIGNMATCPQPYGYHHIGDFMQQNSIAVTHTGC
jgi:hypothetical protein